MNRPLGKDWPANKRLLFTLGVHPRRIKLAKLVGRRKKKPMVDLA